MKNDECADRISYNDQLHAFKSQPKFCDQERSVNEIFSLYIWMIENEFNAAQHIMDKHDQLKPEKIDELVALEQQTVWDRMIQDQKVSKVELLLAGRKYQFEMDPRVFEIRREHEDIMRERDLRHAEEDGIKLTDKEISDLKEMAKDRMGDRETLFCDEQSGFMKLDDFIMVQEVYARAMTRQIEQKIQLHRQERI